MLARLFAIGVFGFFISTHCRAGGLVSNFSCSRPQAVDSGTDFNIDLACKLVDGKTLQKGEVFSFNQCLQNSRGLFKPGRSISNGRFVMSVGGGYCQVATSIYNAVLLAGLPVWERYPHSLYFAEEAYVPAGLDAAVSTQAGADLRFQNVLSHPLTLHAHKEGLTVTVELEGDSKVLKRWVSTNVIKVVSKKVIYRSSSALPAGQIMVKRPGYDGIDVERFVHIADGLGNTKTLSLGVDHYIMVPEIVMKGSEAGTSQGKRMEGNSSQASLNKAVPRKSL